MQKLSFPTRKLKGLIKRVNVKYKNSDWFEEIKLNVYGVTNIDGITITGNNASEDLSNYLILKENQFAYNPYRVNVGSIGLAKKEFLGLVSPAYVVFETKKGLDKDFLFYYLKSNLGLNLIKWYGDRGGVRSALRYSDLENIDIPDLDINQQRQVLEKLKNVDLLLNDYNSSYNKQIKYIKKVRDSILQDALQGKLVPQDPNDEVAEILLEKISEEKERLIKEKKIKREKSLAEISEKEKMFELPKGWCWARIGSVFDTTSGSTPSRGNSDFYNNGTINWVKTRDLNNRFVSKCEEKISERAYDECKLRILPKGTVCIAMYGGSGTIGKCGILNIETTINQSVCGLLSNKFYNYKLLYYFALYIRPYWMNYASGSRVDPNINRNIIKNMIIPIPPMNEQKRIVEKVDLLMALCDQLEKNIEKQKDYSNRLMESILKNSF